MNQSAKILSSHSNSRLEPAAFLEMIKTILQWAFMMEEYISDGEEMSIILNYSLNLSKLSSYPEMELGFGCAV